ncbi:3-deoxy-D-manno-octulosonic-acid transferase [Albidovulum inexpectatum]|uniref:3-deoxy-D-manno-octulosonic acid transferase n=1 Tax=Albidovulum inexpectatum TaxID=196587 RepID=A0A2S5JDZ1_9RHOB|nr:glycosyltransferase N-terminal domain-containing protein [Albidovulum inexpectatum]PPB79621.1 3-deoxy-D-manno-octulosonic-acid transferase [Albidovulum inexpectatum]
MSWSPALALYLIAARRGAARSVAARPERPGERLIWLHPGGSGTPRRLAQLALRITARDDPPAILVTGQEGAAPELDDFPDGTLFDLLPPDRIADLRAFLRHWRPDALVLTETELPPALIVETHRRGIPILLADAAIGAAEDRFWRRGMARALLSRIDRILARDPESAERLRRLLGPQAPVEVAGRIEETTDPLPCKDSDREWLAELTSARPVWLAASCPQGEEPAVIAAHAEALRFAHRTLLVVVPDTPARAPLLAANLRAQGWIVAEWDKGEEPARDVQILVAADEADLGLWYRLAPVTFMGGTLLAEGAGRSPFEPAAFGSAILHGPHFGAYPEAYARLIEARATRMVDQAEELARAVTDMMAPDRAAILAHNAWAVSSGGAEVAERVARAVLDLIEARPRTEVV